MSKELLSRVIMMPDGSVHIASIDKHTLECTPQNLVELLEDPLSFFKEKQFNPIYIPSAPRVNPSYKKDLEDIQGLTLLKIYKDGETVCIFPKLFEVLFENLKVGSTDMLNLTSYIQQNEFSDEKHFFLKFFCEFTQMPNGNMEFLHKFSEGFEVEREFLSETLKTSFSRIPQKSPNSIKLEEHPKSVNFSPKTQTTNSTEDASLLTKENTVSTSEYARMHGIPKSTVQSWCYNNDLRGVVKINGDYRINPNSPLPQKSNKGRKRRNQEDGIMYYKQKFGGDSYAAVQEYIKDKDVVSLELGEYIRSHDELNFYIKNKYYEVNWNGRPCLIIDIDLSYFSYKHQKTNREIILEGLHSPVVPNTDGDTSPEKYVYVVHHVGQKPDSPFAIINGALHQKYHGYLHPPATQDYTPAKKEDLHGPVFSALRSEFWSRYLHEYDKHKSFKKIPKKKVTDANSK